MFTLSLLPAYLVSLILCNLDFLIDPVLGLLCVLQELL